MSGYSLCKTLFISMSSSVTLAVLMRAPVHESEILHYTVCVWDVYNQNKMAPWLIIIFFFSPEQLKTVSVNAGGSVVVPCPEMEGREFVFNLFKDQEMIYNCTRSDENNATSCKPPFTRVGVVQHEKEENNSSHFSLSVVNASSLGIYRCDGMVMFPPPLLKKTSALEILVLVKGKYSKEVQRLLNQTPEAHL